MAMDTPAKIVVLGGGPMGIETALYARFLGYEVKLFERNRLGNNVLQWEHIKISSPFRQLCTSLGIAALKSQDPDTALANPDSQLSGREWVDGYLTPLAQTDLLADNIVLGVTVQSVARSEDRDSADETEATDHRARFSLALDGHDGSKFTETADIVIDTTGVWGHPPEPNSDASPLRGDEDTRPLSQIIAEAGYSGDASLYSELNVPLSDATGGPANWADWLSSAPSETDLQHVAITAAAIVTPEPHFYILGAKSFGRDPRFQMTIGYGQIRVLFSLIGGRSTLDLYGSFPPL